MELPEVPRLGVHREFPLIEYPADENVAPSASQVAHGRPRPLEARCPLPRAPALPADHPLHRR